jgi:poly(A) polymerase
MVIMNNDLKSLLLSNDPVGELRSVRNLRNLESTLADLSMDIPKGFHHKDVLGHSLQVMQNSIDRENGKDLILRTAALFHDIGKPSTREFHGRGKVTFTNHDVVGSKIARKVLPKHGFSKLEVDQVARLVYMHMRSHTFKSGWSESAVRRLSTQAGSDLQLERLIVIFESDATTKHENKRAIIHKNVAELAAELDRVKSSDQRAALRPSLNGNEVAELLEMKPGPELGRVMKFLNSDEIVRLSRAETIEAMLTFVGKN